MQSGRKVDQHLIGGIIRRIVMCELCNGKGWILTFNINMLQWTIERCDTCKVFDNDEEAGDKANAELV